MDYFTTDPQIEELRYFDAFETLMEDPTILDDDENFYDDASFDSFIASSNDF